MSRRRRRVEEVEEESSEGEETFPHPQNEEENESEGEYSEGSYDEELEGSEGGHDEDALQGQIQPQVQGQDIVQKHPEEEVALEASSANPIQEETKKDSESITAKDVKEKKERSNDPSVVPTSGRFFLHDDRGGGRRGGKDDHGSRQLWEEEDLQWVHDKFDSLEVEDGQRPKSFGRGRGRGGRRVGRGRGGKGRGGRSRPSHTDTDNANVQGTSQIQSQNAPTQQPTLQPIIPQHPQPQYQPQAPHSANQQYLSQSQPAQHQQYQHLPQTQHQTHHQPRRYQQQSHYQNYSQQTSPNVPFKRYSATEGQLDGATKPSNYVAKPAARKRYSSQRGDANITQPVVTEPPINKDGSNRRLLPGGEFVPRNVPSVQPYNPQQFVPIQPISMPPVSYGEYNYSNSYTYAGDGQVPYASYYPAQTMTEGQIASGGRGGNQYIQPQQPSAQPPVQPQAPQSKQSPFSKMWVAKPQRKAIPITDPQNGKIVSPSTVSPSTDGIDAPAG